MTQAGPTVQTKPGRTRGSLPAVLAAVLCAGVMVWMGLGWDAIRDKDNYAGKKTDYYSSLVHGFLAGHLYMDKVPDPGLESADPQVRLKAPKLLDASYYKGRFYLYFGVTPAALFLLPYAWLTGADLEPRFVVALSVLLGFLFALGVWRMVVCDRGGRPGGLFQAAAVLALAFATAAPLLLTRAMFYEDAIATGYACIMAGAFWTYRALSGRGRTSVQLALASLSLGLAVGCRPDLVLVVPVLAAAALLLARRGGPVRGGLAALGAAAVLPAAFVGACLAAYNFGRFGSAWDFGFAHSQNKFFSLNDPLARADFFWANFRWDYLTFPSFSPYFPYVFPEAASFRPAGFHGDEAIHGQFPAFVLSAFVAVSAVVLRRRLRLGGLASYLAIVGWMFLAPFVALSFLGLRADRYLVDFQPSLMLVTVLAATPVAQALERGTGKRLWTGAFAALSLWAAAFNILGGLQQFDAFKNIRTPTYRALERIGNYPSFWLGRLGLLRSGPVEIRVVFPGALPTARTEPLLTLGTPDRTDSLYAVEYPGNRIELMTDHRGYLGARSRMLPLAPGRACTIRIDMGALYPPLNHPFFDGYSVMQARLMKTRILVQLDGRVVLDEKMDSYDAPPWTLEAGRNDISLTPSLTEFSGRVLSVRRLPAAGPQAAREDNGLWRIRCSLPEERPNTAFPVLSVGKAGSGTLVYLVAQPDGRVRFAVDEWGIGGETSGPVAPSSAPEHTIEVFIGALAGSAPWPGDWGLTPRKLADSRDRLRVWLDGRLALDARVHRGFDPLDSLVDVGANLQGFSSAQPDYSGPIRSDPYTGDEARQFLARNLDLK